MIIFGTRGVTFTKDSGEFCCPGCGGSKQQYARKSVRRFFTLYFIPLIPLDRLAEYVECQRCKGTYKAEVLEFDPSAGRAKARSEFAEHLKRLMILSALDDGEVDDHEVDAIREVYQEISGSALGDAEIDREVALARGSKTTPAAYAARVAGDLTEHGKEMIIKSVIRVVSIGGHLGEDGHDLARRVSETLGMSSAHFKGIVSEMTE